MAETVSPVINSLSRPFWDAAQEGCLLLPFCPATERFFWPPSPFSPFITAGSVEWRAASPEGTLRALVIYRRGFQEAFELALPYGIGLVALDCGVRVQAHVSSPPEHAIGDPVRLGFAAIVGGGPMVPVVRSVAQPD